MSIKLTSISSGKASCLMPDNDQTLIPYVPQQSKVNSSKLTCNKLMHKLATDSSLVTSTVAVAAR